MRMLDLATGLQALRARGIVPDERYAEPRTLEFSGGGRWTRVSSLSNDLHQRTRAVRRVLTLMPEDEMILVYKRGGSWRVSADHAGFLFSAFIQLLARLEGSDRDGLLIFPVEERALAQALALAAVLTPSFDHQRDDLFLIPERSNLLIWLDHEGLIFAGLPDKNPSSALAAALAGLSDKPSE